MKKLFNTDSKKFRRSIAVIGVIALVCCVGVIHNEIQNQSNLSVSAGYEEYEEGEMNQHNGDVLVDSLNIKGVKGSSKDIETEKKEAPGAENKESKDGTEIKDSTEKDKETVLVTSDDATIIENTDEYFREARETLTYDRNEMISMLTDTIESKEAGAEKNNASEQKIKLMEYMETEKAIESLIRNKGYTDAFVIITDRSVNVTVQTDSLKDEDVAKILDIVIRETGRDAEGIVIQVKN